MPKYYEHMAAQLPEAVLVKPHLAIEEGLHAIQAMEKKGELNPDMPTAVFGKLMGNLFVMEEAVGQPLCHGGGSG